MYNTVRDIIRMAVITTLFVGMAFLLDISEAPRFFMFVLGIIYGLTIVALISESDL